MVDPDAREWPRQQVARIIRDRIAHGTYTSKLPPIEELAREFEVAPRTVQQGLNILKDEGLVVSEPGRGVFVAVP